MTALTGIQLQMMFKDLEDASLYCPFDGDADDDAGSLIPNTEAGGIIYDDDTIDGQAKIGDAIQLAEATTNEINNPSFEGTTLADHWTNTNLNTFEKSTTRAKVGSNSLHAISDNVNDYCHSNAVANADTGETWVAHCWVWIVSGDFKLTIEENDGGWATLDSSTCTTTGSWQYVKIVGTLTGTATDGRVKLGPGSTAASEFYVDCVQFEEKAYPTPYCDGSLGTGHTWSGAAHESTSARTKTQLDYTLTAGSAFSICVYLTPHTLESEFTANGHIWDWFNNANDFVRFKQAHASDNISITIKLDGNSYSIAGLHTATRHTPAHYIITWDGSTLRSYVEGSASGTPISTESNTWGTAPDEFNIGQQTGATNQCNGYIDELIVLNYALTASEVDLIYNENHVNVLAFDGVWTNVLADVRAKEGIKGGYGIKGNGPKDRVASTGILQFYLDNSASNSAAAAGYYSPDHASIRTGFEIGAEIRLRWSYGGQDYYPWRGRIYSISPEGGKYGTRRTQVIGHDWIGAAMRHKIGLIPVDTSVRSDTAISTLVAEMDHAPKLTSYGTGQETFAYFPDFTKDEKSTVVAVAQKICMSEFGFFIRIGDTITGETILYQNRHARVTNKTLEATITESYLTDLKLLRSQAHMFNVVKSITFPREVGASAEDLFTLQTAIEIAAGATKTYTARYSDPNARANRISAHSLEDPEGDNDLSNRGFETDASGWTAATGASFAQSGAQAKHDSYSGLLTSGAGAANTYYVESDAWVGPVQNDIIYYQIYVYAADVWPSAILVEISEYDAAHAIGTTTVKDTVGTSTSSAWVRYSGTHTCVDGDCAEIKIRIGTAVGGSHDFSGGAVTLYIDEAYLIDDAAINFEFSSSDVGGGDLNGDLVLYQSTLGGNSAEFIWENVGSSTGFVTTQKARGLAIRVYDPISYEATPSAAKIKTHERRELELRLTYQNAPLVGEDFAIVTRDKYQDPLTKVQRATFVANKNATAMGAAMTVEPGDRVKFTETQTGIDDEYFINGKDFIIYPDSTGLGTLFMTWYVIAASVEAYWLLGTVGAGELGTYTWLGW